VDEALWRLDRYLNDAFMAGLSSVRIVHGKGTGKLRRAVHDSLTRHPLVKSYRLGDYGEGDYGVTLVELTNH
jgi:DNA mismatch repair protein MutS2